MTRVKSSRALDSFWCNFLRDLTHSASCVACLPGEDRRPLVSVMAGVPAMTSIPGTYVADCAASWSDSARFASVNSATNCARRTVRTECSSSVSSLSSTCVAASHRLG